MINFKEVFNLSSYNIKQKIKDKWYLNQQNKLSNYHYKNCNEYKKISDGLFNGIKKNKLDQIPFVHSSLVKDFDIKNKYIDSSILTYSSSSTSGKKLSKVKVDYKTSLLQSRALKKIFQDFFKKKFKSIFFIDSKNKLKTKNLSAKILAMKGFSQLVDKSFFLKKFR